MASALPVGDLSVRMRNDHHEPNGVKKQRPERIPIDPEHRSYSRNVTAAVAIDSLLQNSGRREHDYATRRIRQLGAGLRIAADTLTFLDFCCHSSVSLQFQNRRSPGTAHRGIGTRAWVTHPFIKTLSFAVDLYVSARSKKNDASVSPMMATRNLFEVPARRDFNRAIAHTRAELASRARGRPLRLV
jgi:hypothetical protein